jgi:hypothetical protein
MSRAPGENRGNDRRRSWDFGVGSVGLLLVAAGALVAFAAYLRDTAVSRRAGEDWGNLGILVLSLCLAILVWGCGALVSAAGLFFAKGRAWAIVGVVAAIIIALSGWHILGRER